MTQDEFEPRELLRKYEWFKDAAAQLDKKQADVQVYRIRLTALEASYGTVPRHQWDRTDKQHTQSVGGRIGRCDGQLQQSRRAIQRANGEVSIGALPMPVISRPAPVNPCPRAYTSYQEGDPS